MHNSIINIKVYTHNSIVRSWYRTTSCPATMPLKIVCSETLMSNHDW